MEKQTTKGYKIFNPDLTCRGFQFEIGKEYKHEGNFKICNSGFHFCLKANDCFNYYKFDSKNIVCEVEALGEVQTHSDDSKAATNHIKIIRQLTWSEVLEVVNLGKDNTGHSNSGNWNTGDSNTGDSNTGNWNTGNRNTGYSNTGDRNTGAFCTGEAPFPIFNKPSNWTEKKYLDSRAHELMCNNVDTKLWIPEFKMTDQEKETNKGWKTAEGYYKDIPFKEAFGNAWNNWSEENRQAFKDLPNFDAAIFEEITGVKI